MDFRPQHVCGLVLISLLNMTALAQSFSISANPSSLTLHPGDVNVPVTIQIGSSSYSGPINVTLTGLPSGITVSPLALSTGSSGILYLSAALNADQEAFPATAAGNANTKANKVAVVGAAGAIKETSSFTLTVSLTNPAYTPTAVDLPIVNIDTSGTPIVDKTTDVAGTIVITSADGSTTYLPSATNTDDTATFHLHGNSTLSMPKKAYHVKLHSSLDLLGVMGLSCPYVTGKGKPTCDKSKSFILLANYDDKTLLRDWAASALANAIPYGGNYLSQVATAGTTPPSPSGTSTVMPWAPHSLFVELYLNGAYMGNYQLIEEVKVDGNRVNISELTESDITDDITGGYLMEIDHHEDEAFVWKTPKGIPIGLIDPDFTPDPEVPEQTSYIQNYVNEAETALFSSEFTNPTTGWRNYFDEATAVNWYIVNDVMGNVDGGDFESSDYLYKAIDNQYLYMGPIWDFDISSGNVNYKRIYNPTVPWVQSSAAWYEQWFKDPGFKADVIKQWNQLQADGVFTSWLASINSQSTTLELSQANNFARWPMLGERVWPNYEAAGSYSGEVNYLTNWLSLRIAYLDAQFNGKTSTATTLTAPVGTLRSGTPVSLSAKVTGAESSSGTVSFLSGGVLLGDAPLSEGTAAGSFNLPTGSDALTAVYSGDTTHALSSSSSKTVTVLAPLAASITSLSASATTANLGQSISFPILVVGTSGTSTPSGSVAVTVNGNSLGTVKLSSGTGTFSTTALPVGNDVISANYGGDTNYDASSSPTVNVSVSQTASGCTAPASPGVNVCTPAESTTVTSPVQISAAAAVSGGVYRFEIWNGSTKVASVSNSSTMTESLTLSPGTYHLLFDAYNKAGTHEKLTRDFTVGSGGGGSCTVPISAGVNVCTPAENTTVTSPVQISAAAAVSGGVYRFEIWNGGTKVASVSNSSTMTESLTLPPGTYHLVFNAYNKAGTHEKLTRDFSVGTGSAAPKASVDSTTAITPPWPW